MALSSATGGAILLVSNWVVTVLTLTVSKELTLQGRSSTGIWQQKNGKLWVAQILVLMLTTAPRQGQFYQVYFTIHKRLLWKCLIINIKWGPSPAWSVWSVTRRYVGVRLTCHNLLAAGQHTARRLTLLPTQQDTFTIILPCLVFTSTTNMFDLSKMLALEILAFNMLSCRLPIWIVYNSNDKVTRTDERSLSRTGG